MQGNSAIDNKASVSPDESNYQAQMGVTSAHVDSRPMMASQNSYQQEQPIHNSIDHQYQIDQAAQPHFDPAPDYASRQQSPALNATDRQMPQFPHQKELLPQQKQIQAQMQASNPQLTPTNYQTAVPLQGLSDSPAPVDCPRCGNRQLTRTEYDAGGTTHAWAAILCIFTLCCCIPYMIKATQDVNHYCSHCGAFLARWHRSGRTEVKAHA